MYVISGVHIFTLENNVTLNHLRSDKKLLCKSTSKQGEDEFRLTYFYDYKLQYNTWWIDFSYRFMWVTGFSNMRFKAKAI